MEPANALAADLSGGRMSYENVVVGTSDFTPLSLLDLSDDERIDIFWTLRGAFEETNPDRMVDASDAYVLTVLPFGEGDEIPDDYEVENWATGQYQGQPALARYEGEQVSEVLVME